MKRFVFLGIAALLLGTAALDAAPGEPQQYISIGRIRPVTVEKGKTVEAVVPIRVAPGMHVQANPASNPQLIPTKLEMPGVKGLTAGNPKYPPGKSYRLQGAAAELATYDGRFEIRVPLTLTGKMESPDVVLTGKLKYQACNDKICFFPTTTPVHIPVSSGSH